MLTKNSDRLKAKSSFSKNKKPLAECGKRSAKI